MTIRALAAPANIHYSVTSKFAFLCPTYCVPWLKSISNRSLSAQYREKDSRKQKMTKSVSVKKC